MIKILYIVSSLKKCGPINILYNIVKYLDKKKYRVYIATLSGKNDKNTIDDFKNIDCNIIILNIDNLSIMINGKNRIRDIISSKNIKLVHGHGIRADYLISKLNFLDNIKTYSTVHNYPYYDYRMTYGNLKGTIMSSMHLKFLKKIDNPIACSKSISNMFLESKKYSIEYIQNGVDIERYSSKYNKIKLREELKLPINKQIFISVGHLSTRKDPLTIINAFKKIDDGFLIFLGKGDLDQVCINTIDNNKNIKLIGFVNNVTEYLQAADYFISASKAEGLPNTVMEAMACGLPCILSDIEPHKEILEFNNLAGLTFKVGSEEDLRSKINIIQANSYDKVSYNARKLIEENLNAEIMSQKYQKIYENIKVDL